MNLSRAEIESRIKDIVSGALEIELSEIQVHSSLIDDLGAESIDFLDIRYRLETEFEIKIPDEELWQGTIITEPSGYVTAEGVTDLGLDYLKSLMPDFRWDRFPGGVRSGDFPRLLTTRTIIEYLCKRFDIRSA